MKNEVFKIIVISNIASIDFKMKEEYDGYCIHKDNVPFENLPIHLFNERN